MGTIWPILTIAVTLLGVALLVLSAAEPLLVAVAERRSDRRSPSDQSRGRHVHLPHHVHHH
jgi:hypothetical protein